MDEEVGDEPIASEDDTRRFLLARSNRTFAPIGKVFVQAPRGDESRHAPLATFVQRGDLRGLRAYIFLLGIISSGRDPDGWSTALPIPVWARAFDTTVGAERPAASAAVSKILKRLEDRRLIERSRRGRERTVRVTLLREDGSGNPYSRPGRANSDRYFKLPHTFWLEGLYRELDLPATAMLLVAHHEKPGFRLATERVPEWYGWSADTAERGFAKLIQLGYVNRTRRKVTAPLRAEGWTWANHYRLAGPFAQSAEPETPDASTGDLDVDNGPADVPAEGDAA